MGWAGLRVLAAQADARLAAMSGRLSLASELIERALRNEHLRLALAGYTARTVPALNIDAYAAQVYTANRESGL